VVHIPDPDIAVGIPILRDCDQSRRRVDSRAGSAAKSSKFDGQPRSARNVKELTANVYPQLVVEGNVLSAVARLTQGREIYRPASPTFVNA
jgi:hypothetical protein